MKEKVLIFGCSGLVGSKFIDKNKNAFEIIAPSQDDVDILDFNSLKKTIQGCDANFVLNFAAFTNVDKAEEEKGDKNGLVYRLNSEVTKNMADLCKADKKHLIYFSTDYVFNGEKSESPYLEEDKPDPVDWYGQTKYFGETYIQASGIPFTIIRLSMPFTDSYDLKSDIARFFVSELGQGKEVTAVSDQIVTPVLTDELADAIGILIKNKAEGIYHTVCSTHTTPFDFAKLIAKKFGFNESLIKSVSFEEYGNTRPAKRPKYGWLSTEKFESKFGKEVLHTTEEAIDIFHQNWLLSKEH
jgi:dTDP-4-dehydrorhamnose reductase